LKGYRIERTSKDENEIIRRKAELVQYMPLDLIDVTGVTQGSQTHSFVYDSLKRLKEAHNPETTDQTHDQSLQFITYTVFGSL
jgi:YD repeat-containing protein